MNQTATQEPQEKAFKMYKLTLKDVSFETPNSPKILTMYWDPEIDLEISTDSTLLRKKTYEVVLSLTVTAKNGGRTAYLIEVNQAAIFGLKGYEDAQLNYMLNSFCPNILYPFARETAVSMVQKGGFEQLTLMPIDFDMLHQKKMEAARKAKEADEMAEKEGGEPDKGDQETNP